MTDQTNTTYLITGAGSGFGKEVALRLAEQGHDVIAGVEIIAQVNVLRAEAKERGVDLRVEKLDVTDEGDRDKAAQWDVDVLLNNAGISEGGSSVDIPAANIRRQFEVNVFGPILLTQPIAKAMVAKGEKTIDFRTFATASETTVAHTPSARKAPISSEPSPSTSQKNVSARPFQSEFAAFSPSLSNNSEPMEFGQGAS